MSSSSSFIHPSVYDTLVSYLTERKAYESLLAFGYSAADAQHIVVILMWFRSLGCSKVFLHLRIHAADRPTIALRMADEARLILRFFLTDEAPLLDGLVAFPIIACDWLNVSFFQRHRQSAILYVTAILIGDGQIIFNDRIQESFQRYNVLAEAYRQHSLYLELLPELARPSEEAIAELSASAEDQRSIYVTFSKTNPVTEEEITEYFINKFGLYCLEKVKVATIQGKVVFNKEAYKRLILNGVNGAEPVKLLVNGKDMFARQFQPK